VGARPPDQTCVDNVCFDAAINDAAEPLDAGTDASLPPFTFIRDPARLAGLVIFRPLGHVVPICAGPACIPSPGIATGIFQIGRYGGCAGPASCATTCGPGTAVCFNGHYAGCTAAAIEQCNLTDDDCDGRIDEGASAFCSDGLACTRDYCAVGSCLHDLGVGFHGAPSPFGPLCQPTGTPTCEFGFCGISPDVIDVDPRDTVTPQDANGCALLLQNSVCQDSPRGFCGGKRERCAPRTRGSDADTGCEDFCSPIVTVGAPVDVASGMEASGTFSPAPGGGIGSLVIGYNDAAGRGGVMNWAFDRLAAGPSSWTSCDPLTMASGSGCLAPIVSTPATATPRWAGDPVVAADGRGNVVMVSLENGNRNLVASISTDGGRSFGSTVRVNDDAFECRRTNTEDQPAVTFNLDGPTPHLWVVWRHSQPILPPWDGTSGACIRGGTLTLPGPGAPPGTQAGIAWFADARQVDRMEREQDDGTTGQGGVRVLARNADINGRPNTETIVVMYSNTDHQFYDCSTRSIGWDTVLSANGGLDWFGSFHVAHTDSFNWCVPGTVDVSRTVRRSFREFDIALDRSTGLFWAVVAYSGTLAVYISGGDAASWEYVTGVTNTRGRAIWLPSLAVDEDGHVAATYYATNDASGTVQRFVVASAAGARDLTPPWSAPIAISDSFVADRAQSAFGADYTTTFAVPRSALGPNATIVGAWSEFDPTVTPPGSQDRLRTASIVVAP
jgi:hypothetical protein